MWEIYDSIKKDTTVLLKTSENLDTWLPNVNRSGLPGRFKTNIYIKPIYIYICTPCYPGYCVHF